MRIQRFVPKSLIKVTAKAQKNSPNLLFGAGIVGVLGGTVLACRATLKLGETLDDFKAEVDDNKANASQQDMAYIYGKNTLKVVKLYAPAVAVGGLGIAALTGSHVQLSKRNTALTAAYTAVSGTLANYRRAVEDELGAEQEQVFYEKAVTMDADHNKETLTKVGNTNKLSGYARIFDESNPEWKPDAEWNKARLRAVQQYFNDLLQIRGHVFLNEVYEQLGFEHSSAGAVVGWVINSDGGDNYIDFGLYDPHNSRFHDTTEAAIILDFNVDGVIYDQIG